MPRRLRSTAVALLLAPVLFAQQSPIEEPRVREVVSWLAADERRGRDTGSVELEQCADWLAQQFEAAGLQPGSRGTFFHEWTLPGLRLDSSAVTVTLTRRFADQETVIVAEPGRDVRWLRPGDGDRGEAEACTVVHADDPALPRVLLQRSARRPFVLEVDEQDPDWLRTATAHTQLGGVRGASRPVFLVRKGLLPAAPTDGREATWTLTWSTPAVEKIEVPLRNVVALLPGTTKKDQYVVMSAHYDHIGIGRAVAGDAIYNGADDNATGTTAVLLAAAAMAKAEPPARSVLFVCFAGEERGLLGSAAFCDRPPVPREQIVANLNLEMVGRPEPGNEGKAWLTGPGYSDFADIVRAPMQQAGVELIGFEHADMLFAQSDNWSFAQKGIVAHSLSAGSLHRDYHQPGDEVGKLDLAHMTRILRALVPAVRALADRDTAPAWTDAGRAVVERGRR
ncbi:MAG: M28 family peptidase [Planctomycetes bacterium]|nr:M28 family peptidase [Planctomycetota bacterium]